MPSNSDGGPTAWFTPGYAKLGPGFAFHASDLSTYPNKQEAGTLWYHPHDQGLTRINVYTGLAGYYFLRGPAEEAAKLPGWSGDDKVQEVTPAGKAPTFNGTNSYLPEVEIAIQDRMFNVNGELYWPVAPTNPEIHPFWTPEFFGDIMTVNGKAWPYLSVAPRKYRFRMLEGCNARFLNLWLQGRGVTAPVITVIGSDGQIMDTPAVLDAGQGKTLFMAPGERFDVVIDFTGFKNGTIITLMNNAPAPYPTGTPVSAGTTDRIMQFIVNGNMVSANGGTPSDKSKVPSNLRAANPMVKLTDFAGNLAPGVKPDVKRQIILNEVTGAGGPAQVLFNNSHFDANSPIPGAPQDFGGPTELPTEGTTEQISVINTTVDAHPIHIHLLQWQLVSRQAFDVAGFMTAYQTAWASHLPLLPEWPAGQGYPGGSGSPQPYNTPNADGAVGGNPAITPFLMGPVIPANPEEMVWKDDIKSFPGQVVTYIVRAAPTDRPINAAKSQLMFPFDPSLGPGYVWHCHIIDHEDMDMMRPLIIQPSPLRFPQITDQPSAVKACLGTPTYFEVTAKSATTITYQWQVSKDVGVTFTDLTNTPPYKGVSTNSLKIDPATTSLTNYLYRVVLTNVDGVTTSNTASLIVNTLPIPTITGNNSVCTGSITNVYTSEAGMTKYSWSVSTGGTITSGGTTADNKITITWTTSGAKTVSVNYTNENGCRALAPTIFNVTVSPLPVITLTGPSSVSANTSNVYTTQTGMTNYSWAISAGGIVTTGGTPKDNTITVKWIDPGTQTVSVNYANANDCSAMSSKIYNVTVNSLPVPTFIEFPDNNSCRLKIVTYTTQGSQKNYVWTFSGKSGTDYSIISGGTKTNNSTKLIWLTTGSKTVTANYTNADGITGVAPAVSTITVVNLIPSTPSNFTASSNHVTRGQSAMYTVPFEAGVNYNWDYWGSGVTITGSSNSVLVNYSSTATSGTLLVTVSNGCGTSLPRVLFVTVDRKKEKSGILGETNPVTYDLPSAQNELKAYPNPSNGPVIFEFRIGENAKATLDLSSMSGQLIDRIFDANVEAGAPQNVFYDKSLAPGVYLYILRWNNQLLTGKLIITR
jgi:FtsP/CotA-like multicopper oxidase with cupredoxin domain